MKLYRVTYQSMTAFYGPDFIEAESAEEAREKFGKGAFSAGERCLIRATPVSADEVRAALAGAQS